MCEMASSCLCVVALAMASGSCNGKGNTSLQTREKKSLLTEIKSNTEHKCEIFWSKWHQVHCLATIWPQYGHKPDYCIKNNWFSFPFIGTKTNPSWKCLGPGISTYFWPCFWNNTPPADTVEGHQTTQVREAERRVLQGKSCFKEQNRLSVTDICGGSGTLVQNLTGSSLSAVNLLEDMSSLSHSTSPYRCMSCTENCNVYFWSDRWIKHAILACFILTGVLLTDEALLNRGGTCVRCRSQTQHLPLAGAAFTHQKGLEAPATTTDSKQNGTEVLLFPAF